MQRDWLGSWITRHRCGMAVLVLLWASGCGAMVVPEESRTSEGQEQQGQEQQGQEQQGQEQQGGTLGPVWSNRTRGDDNAWLGPLAWGIQVRSLDVALGQLRVRQGAAPDVGAEWERIGLGRCTPELEVSSPLRATHCASSEMLRVRICEGPDGCTSSTLLLAEVSVACSGPKSPAGTVSFRCGKSGVFNVMTAGKASLVPIFSSGALTDAVPLAALPSGVALHVHARENDTGGTAQPRETLFQVTAVSPSNPGEYTVQRWRPEAAAEFDETDPAGWEPLCRPAQVGGTARTALVLPGTWTPTGAWQDDSGLFTFACHRGVLAKCATWGYTPWTGRSVYHQTCTRVARADYCGTGEAHTVDGTVIDLEDVPAPSLTRVNSLCTRLDPTTGKCLYDPADFYLEAVFAQDQQAPMDACGDGPPLPSALCLSKKRWETIPLGGFCPATLVDPRVYDCREVDKYKSAYCRRTGRPGSRALDGGDDDPRCGEGSGLTLLDVLADPARTCGVYCDDLVGETTGEPIRATDPLALAQLRKQLMRFNRQHPDRRALFFTYSTDIDTTLTEVVARDTEEHANFIGSCNRSGSACAEPTWAYTRRAVLGAVFRSNMFQPQRLQPLYAYRGLEQSPAAGDRMMTALPIAQDPLWLGEKAWYAKVSDQPVGYIYRRDVRCDSLPRSALALHQCRKAGAHDHVLATSTVRCNVNATTELVCPPGYEDLGLEGYLPYGPRPGQLQAEICNGVDDNGDGLPDTQEPGDQPLALACYTEARRKGTAACIDGRVGACVTAREQCNGRDDDCDGWVDNAVENQSAPLAQSCATACGTGTEVCAGGQWGTCSARQPTTEVCDGVDDDCDGTIDQSPVDGRNLCRSHAGITWGVDTDRNPPAGNQFVGCFGQPPLAGSWGSGCNSEQGDTACSARLPVLCIRVTGAPRPPGLPILPVPDSNEPPEYSQGWAEGDIALTASVLGTSLTSRAAGDALCVSRFGTGWRMAEFHDGRQDADGESGGVPGGWSFYASGNVTSTSRFWVAIDGQRANCWDPVP